MPQESQPQTRKASGYVLITVLVALLVAGTVASAAAVLATGDLMAAAAHRDGIAAFYLAEAGAEYALSRLRENPALRGNLGTMPLGRGATAGTYTVLVTDHPGQRVAVTATGAVGRATRVVKMIVSVGAVPGAPVTVHQWQDHE